jgi:DNA polymerase IIIc chi subunit
MAIICDGYPKVQVFKDNFVSIQQAITRLVDGLLEEGFTPRLVETYWAKGAAIVVCQDEETRDRLGSEVAKMNA